MLIVTINEVLAVCWMVTVLHDQVLKRMKVQIPMVSLLSEAFGRVLFHLSVTKSKIYKKFFIYKTPFIV